MKIPNRPSRKTFLGTTVGQPTNDSLTRLNEESLDSYSSALETQIQNEKNPKPAHKEALNKAQEKLNQELELRSRLRG